MCCVEGGVRGACPFGWEVLPVALVVVCWVGFISTYIIAVALDHVEPVLPMISATGTRLPERGLFTLILFTIALLFFVVSVKVYRLNTLHYAHPSRRLRVTNMVGMASSTLATIGLATVGSFQESRSVFTVLHGTGSIIAFSFLCVTMSIQAAVSLHIRRTLGRRGIVAMVQAAMAVTSWFLAIVYLLLLMLPANRLGIQWHCIAAAAVEWVSVYFIALFPLTFHGELQRGRVLPEGAGQEEVHLLDTEQLNTA